LEADTSNYALPAHGSEAAERMAIQPPTRQNG
jgi:hypothetical protein